MEVMQHFSHASGGIRQQPLRHTIFLSGAFAEAPARQKWVMFLAVAAYLGCGFCLFQGSRMGASMTFRGYAARVQQTIMFGGTAMHASDARLRLTDRCALPALMVHCNSVNHRRAGLQQCMQECNETAWHALRATPAMLP